MNHYRLPRQSYKCGNTPTGDSCPLGPFYGRCSQSHSDPYKKICRPLRTLVWWNRSIQMSATLLALIGVGLAWSNLGGKQSIAPGPLSLSHAQLLVSAHSGGNEAHGMDTANRCASCHPANQIGSTKLKQSDLCLKCHIQEMPDAAFGSPHDLHGKSLHELVANGDHTTPKSSLARLVSRSPIAWKETTDCSQCHREHQGGGQDLKEISSTRCQACHRNQFQSFATDHPEFNNYPYDRTKNIEFDHVKHRDLHFSKKATNFDCKTCHIQSDQVGAVGQVFRSVSFEQACASCHTEPIKSAIHDGLIVLQVPSVNRKELLIAGADIGIWPSQASQLTDGVIPPIMRMLIESEPGGLALLNDLPSTGRLAELDMAHEQGRDTLVKLSFMTKQLIRRMGNEGQPGFRSSIEKLLSASGPLSPSDRRARQTVWLDRFASGMPPDLFRAAWNEWFKDEKTESVNAQSFPVSLSPVRLSFGLRFANDDLLLGNGNSLLNSGDETLLTKDTLSLSDSQGKGNSASELFRDTRAWDQLAFGGWMIDRQRMAIVYVPRGHADEWLSRWIELEEMKPSGQQHKIEMAKQCRQCHDLKPANQSNESLYHENWNVSFRNANQIQLSQATLVSSEGPNACWRSKRRAANIRQITKFDHTPHLALPKISDCRSCHVLESNPNVAWQDHDPIAPGSPHVEFAPMQKSQCASCHQPNAAGESCTQCHNYHVGIKGWHGGRE